MPFLYDRWTAIRDILWTKGEGDCSDADVRTFWCKNLWIFLKFMVCPHGQGRGEGSSQCGQGERGQFYRDFVRMSFMDGSLFQTAFSCSFLAKPYPCLFILLMSQNRSKINKQGYGLISQKGTRKRDKRSEIATTCKYE